MNIELEKWINELISGFREEYQKLSEDEQTKVSNLDDLSYPCQVEVVWLKHSRFKLDFQLIIFTHFEDKEDLEIVIHNPIELYQAIETLEGKSKNPKWDRKLPEEEHFVIIGGEKKYSTLIEDLFIRALQECKNYITSCVFSKRDKSTNIKWKHLIADRAFLWFVIGDIQREEPKEIIEKIIEEAKRNAKSKSQPSPKPERIKGYGTFFYPPIKVGELPKQTFRERVLESPLRGYSEKAFDTEYNRHKVIVNRDGFIAVAIDDKRTATQVLNLIMATFLLHGIPTFAIRENEVGSVEIDPKNLNISGSTMSFVSLRTVIGQERWQHLPPIIPTKRAITEEELKVVVKLSESVASNEKITNSLLFFLEAFTYLQNSEYTQSFIMSWMLIERYLSDCWDSFLDKLEIRGDRRDKLKSTLLWKSADRILEVLSLSDKLAKEDYKLLMKLKQKRNDIIHRGKKASEEEAQKSFNFCINLLGKMMENATQ